MERYVGIDGGGTKTRVSVGDAQGAELRSFTVGSTNHHSSSAGHVKNSVCDIFKALEGELSSIAGICFAGAGVDTLRDEAFYTGLFREFGYQKRLLVCSDGLAALAGSNGGLRGAILIAGTGSITLAIAEDGTLIRAGGWGYRTEGCCSGYALAVEGIKAAGLEYDGIGPKTLITERLKALLRTSDFPGIIDAVYNGAMSNGEIAALSRAVTETCGEDEVARAIVDRAAEEALDTLVPVVKRLGRDDFDVGLCGGVFENAVHVRQAVIEKINKRYPVMKPHLPYFNAGVGALRLAAGNISLNITEDGQHVVGGPIS